jgi:hypothetical protein
VARQLTLIASIFNLFACSSSGNSDGSGGATSTGGTSMGGTSAGGGGTSAGGSSAGGSSATGGSSTNAGASGTVVQGAISVNLQAGAGCSLMAQYLDFPTVAGGHPVTATADSAGIADQQLDSNGISALVSCGWYSDTAPYQVATGITLGNGANERSASIGSNFPSTVGATSQGNLILQVPELPDESGYTAPCTFTIIKLDPATRSVWGSFTCDSFNDSTPTATKCTVGPSYFYFNNCTKP